MARVKRFARDRPPTPESDHENVPRVSSPLPRFLGSVDRSTPQQQLSTKKGKSAAKESKRREQDDSADQEYCRFHEKIDECIKYRPSNPPLPALSTLAQHGAVETLHQPYGQDEQTPAEYIAESVRQLREMERNKAHMEANDEGEERAIAGNSSNGASPPVQEQQEQTTDDGSNGDREELGAPHPPAAVNGELQHGDLPNNLLPPAGAELSTSRDLDTDMENFAHPAGRLHDTPQMADPTVNGLSQSQSLLPIAVDNNTAQPQLTDAPKEPIDMSLFTPLYHTIPNFNDVNQASTQEATQEDDLASSINLQGTDMVEPYNPPPATGFAKLEFIDGHFFMTTYAVELGRDLRTQRIFRQAAAREQMEKEQQSQKDTHGKTRSSKGSSRPATPSQASMAVENGSGSARNFVSDTGGIVGQDDAHIDLSSRRGRKNGKSKSTDTSSRRSQISRKNSVSQSNPDLSHLELAPTVDPNATKSQNPLEMPDLNYVPLIPLHPPKSADEPWPTGKGISRKHVRVAYNFDRGGFDMTIIGRNGAFHDDEHYAQGEVVPLEHGSHVEFGGVYFDFMLPDAPISEPAETFDESQSGRMSFSFEDGRGESILADDDNDSLAESYDSDGPRWVINPQGWATFQEDPDNNEEQDDEEEDEEEESEDGALEVAPVRLKLKTKAAAPKKLSKYQQKKQAKAEKKAKLKLNAQKKKREREEAEAKEREAQAAKRKKAKLKEAAKEKAKAQQGETSNQGGKEPSKDLATPREDGKSKEPAVPRISRDTALTNGVDVNVPGLPADAIIPPRKKGPGRPPKDGLMSKRERSHLVRLEKERQKAIKLGLDPSQIPLIEDKPPKPRQRKNSQGEEVEGEGNGADGEDKKANKTPKPPRPPSPVMREEDYTEEQLQRPTSNYVYLIYEAIQQSEGGVLNLQQIYSAIEHKYPFFKFKVTSNGWQSSVRHNLGQHEAFRKVEKEGKGWLWGIKDGVPIERERKKKTPPPQAPPQGYPQYPYAQYGGYPPHSAAPSYPGGPPGYSQPRHHPPAASLVPPSLAQQAMKPPPGLGQSSPSGSGTQTQTYSSPYAKDAIKIEGGNSQAAPPRQGPYGPYPPAGQHPQPSHPATSYPSHQPGYRPGGPPKQPSESTTPPLPPSQNHSQPPTHVFQRPTNDVIKTFKDVFIASMSDRKQQGIDSTRSEAIVSAAIRRVLEPHAMQNVPLAPAEQEVVKAFRTMCDHIAGQARGQQPQAQPPQSRGATNVVATAAMSAAATAGAQGTPHEAMKAQLAAGNGKSSSQAPPTLPASQNMSTTPATTTNQPKPQRPAEANLIGMLMGSGSSTSPAPQGNPATVPSVKTQVALVNGRKNGNSTPTRPAVEPLTPPAIPASPILGMKRPASADMDTRGESEDPKRTKLVDGNGIPVVMAANGEK